MTARILGPRGSRRRRRFVVGPMLAVALVALLLAAGAQAVHDVGVFELDADQAGAKPAVTDNATSGLPDDWDRVCHTATASLATPQCVSATDDHAIARSFDVEVTANGGANNATIFTGGGSKDPEALSSWKWKDASGGLPDKDNLLHAMAARYSGVGTPAGEYLFFGADRFDNSGDAQIGFWFFREKVSLNQATGGFNGAHTAGSVPHDNANTGDLLILSDFTQGGTQPTIQIFEYVGSGGSEGSLNKIAGGITDIRDCATVGSGDAFCASVNPADGATAPWLYRNKSGQTTFAHGEFYEGGLNLTALGFNQCFASFLSETRSSQSVSATLKDFVLGDFQPCSSETVTTPLKGDGTVITGPLSIGTGSVSVKDRAVVKVDGTSSFGGDVTFFLCKLDSPALCDDSDADHHGTQIGSPQAIGPPSPVTVTSIAATVTSAGRYCWRAVYSGDPDEDVPGSSDSRASECFTVNPVTPTLTTQASSDVVLGNPISDTATLTGTANKPGTPVINPSTAGGSAGGSITFTAYGPDDCTTVAFGPVTRPVSGDGTYPKAGQAAVSFTPTAVGTYTWVASYNGDSPNTNSVPNSVCPDTSGAENVKVTDTSDVVTAQNWLPNDSATITSDGGSALSGSVTFTLYDNGTCDPGENNANVLYTEGPIAVSGSSPQTRHTSNTNVKVLATDTVSWRAVFTSSDQDVAGSSGSCETTALTIDNN